MVLNVQSKFWWSCLSSMLFLTPWSRWLSDLEFELMDHITSNHLGSIPSPDRPWSGKVCWFACRMSVVFFKNSVFLNNPRTVQSIISERFLNEAYITIDTINVVVKIYIYIYWQKQIF